MSVQRVAEDFGSFYREISNNIYAYCLAVRFSPTWQQVQLLDAVQRGDTQIAVRSGQGPGKTTAMVVIAGYEAIRNFYAKVVVTAPSMKQCRDVFMAEFRKVMRNADPRLQAMFEITATTAGVMGHRASDWGIILQTSSTSEGAQGQHREDMVIIMEEASGVPREIVEQYEGTISGKNNKLFAIGNPNTRDCAFFDFFHGDAKNWTLLHWNAEETPESKWFTRERNRKVADKYGINSDVYRVRVLGEFPRMDPNNIISEELLRLCWDRSNMIPAMRSPRLGGTLPAKQFGIDFARYGSDESTIFRRSGNAIVEHEYLHHVDPAEVVDLAFKMQRQAGWTNKDTIFVPDAAGMGQGVMHRFHEADKTTFEFQNHSNAVAPDFENRISEAWFHVAHLVKDPKKRLFIPSDSLLTRQLTSRQYYTTRKGKIVIESKDEYMRRGFDSPDRADGLVMAFYDAACVVGNFSTLNRGADLDATRRRNR